MNTNTKEDSILLALLEDRAGQCEDHYMMTASGFLDMRQRTLAERFCREKKLARYAFYGGFEEAERCIALFYPEYMDIGAEGADGYFQANPEEDPLAVVRAKAVSKQRPLTHRDYLGSLTGLGLKRDVIGDILVREDGADIMVDREITEFLLYHYGKAGRANLELSVVPTAELIVPEARTEEKGDTVASLRLDNVIASVFGTSRGNAADAVRGGLVFVNSLQVQKPDAPVREGDKLVLRGRGKALLKEVGGQTRKDRTFIRFLRYL